MKQEAWGFGIEMSYQKLLLGNSFLSEAFNCRPCGLLLLETWRRALFFRVKWKVFVEICLRSVKLFPSWRVFIIEWDTGASKTLSEPSSAWRAVGNPGLAHGRQDSRRKPLLSFMVSVSEDSWAYLFKEFLYTSWPWGRLVQQSVFPFSDDKRRSTWERTQPSWHGGPRAHVRDDLKSFVRSRQKALKLAGCDRRATEIVQMTFGSFEKGQFELVPFTYVLFSPPSCCVIIFVLIECGGRPRTERPPLWRWHFDPLLFFTDWKNTLLIRKNYPY